MLAGFLAFGSFWGAWAALVPAVEQATEVTRAELGLALAFVVLGSVPAMVLAGPVIDRRGPRVLPVALATLAAVSVGPGLASSLPGLCLALLLVGVASGVVDVAVNAAVAELEASTETRLMQLAHALFSLGLMGGALGAGAARELGAGRAGILVAVAAVVAAAAASNLGYPSRAAERLPRRRLRVRRPAVVFGLACGAAFLVEGGIESWSALFAERELGAGPGAAALAPAAYAAAMVIGRLSGQWLDRRLGDTLLVGAGAAVSLTGLAVVALAPTLPVAVGGFFLGGLGVAVVAPAMFGAAGRSAPPGERASAVATATTLGYGGFLVGPPVVGALAETIGLRGAFSLLAAVAAGLALSAPRLGLERRR